ncbi:response regulator transcription factor [Corynebacterium mastitidis]|uniref:DNA-binding response regulator n=1 Tax=Corynebacterium mastitidis TaxID=161890 RepID=A0A2N0X6Q4_9CORY|nr:response regulator transcription factor [Corynebacterium mastitidis]PKF68369.1 DNA-binding response regulator [Corynebacterium mastitidis]
MSEKIAVGLVDDQPLVRTGFAMLVNSQDDMRVAWDVSDGDQVPGQDPVDVVLMDVQMARVDGITAAQRLIEQHPQTRVIMLTTFDDHGFVRGAVDAGASGFLLKDAQPEELLRAVRVVHSGEAVLAPKVTANILRDLVAQHPAAPPVPMAPTPTVEASAGEQAPVEELTRRELHVLRLMALGLNNQEIAEREVVSMATVKTHVRHILMKTRSRDRVQAVLFAYRRGLVSPQELLNHPQG